MKLVRRTEIPKPEMVYNLHIKNDHNYVAAGAVASNCHSAKADVLKDLLTGPMANIPIRWGLTGTIPKEDFEFTSLLVSLGPVVGEIKASDLQEQGVLAQCQVDVVQLQDEGEYGTYHDEYEYLTTDPLRLEHIANRCKEISNSGNTLILVDRIETGEVLRELIGDGAVFISGKVKTKDRKKEYKEVQSSNNKVIIDSIHTNYIHFTIRQHLF